MFWTLLTCVALAGFPGPHAEQDARFGGMADPVWRSAPRRAPPPPSPMPSPGVTVYGYHPYWGSDPTAIDYSRLTHIAIFNVDLDSDGSLLYTSRWTGTAPDVVPLAHFYGVKVDLCVTSFDDDVMSAVLGDATKRATAVSALQSLVEAYEADGVNVDFEGLPSANKADFVAFIQELAAAVDEVYIATPAVDWAGAYDYDELANASDGLFIMGYGYHWSGGNPGPVDPLFGGGIWSAYSLDWTVADYLDSGAPADKIVLGLPLYGRWWPVESYEVPGTATASGDAVLYEDAVLYADAAGALYDEDSHTPYAFYDGGQLWYGDTESVRERVAWARDAGLQGVGFWALTYEDEIDGFWDMMAEETADQGGTGGGEEGGGTEGGGAEGGGSSDRPVAQAGVSFLAYPGDTVILDGSGSYDPDDEDLTYRWTQLDGPAVSLDGGDTATPSFVADQPGTLTFELVVFNGIRYSDGDSMDVVVVDPAAGTRYGLGGGCAAVPVGGGLPLALLALFSRRRRK